MKIALPIAGVLLLAACTQYRPAVTADQVLAQQYAARGIHGAQSGAEAQIVSDNYRKAIGAHPADPPAPAPSP